MNRPLSFFCLFLAATRLALVGATTIANPGPVGRPQAGGGPTYLVEENCEGTGTPASWTDSGATAWDDGTPTAEQGSESLNLYATATDITTASPTFAATTDVHVFYRLYITALPSSGRALTTFRSTATVRETINIGSTGSLAVVGGSTTVATMNTGTWYYVWLGYNAGTGAAYAAFSSTSTKPSPGDNYTTGSQAGTADVDNVRLFSDYNATAGPDINIDRILVDDASIGNNP